MFPANLCLPFLQISPSVEQPVRSSHCRGIHDIPAHILNLDGPELQHVASVGCPSPRPVRHLSRSSICIQDCSEHPSRPDVPLLSAFRMPVEYLPAIRSFHCDMQWLGTQSPKDPSRPHVYGPGQVSYGRFTFWSGRSAKRTLLRESPSTGGKKATVTQSLHAAMRQPGVI